MATNQITQIYELKSLGTDQLLRDLDAVNKSFASIKKSALETKAALATATGNPQEAARLTEELKKQEIQMAKTSRQSEALQADLKAMIEMDAEAAKNKGTLAVSVDQLTGSIRTASEAQQSYNEAAQGGAAAAEQQEQQYVAIAERLLLLRTEAKSTAESLALLQEQLAEGAISAEEFAKRGAPILQQQELLRQQLAQTTAELKIQAQQELAGVGSIDEMRVKVAALTKERNSVNQTTAQGTVRVRELNAEIDKQNALIKATVDAYQKQKINIGNYPTLTAELRAVNAELQRMALAGERDSLVFKDLTARAAQLAAAQAEVVAATKAAVAASEQSAAGIGTITTAASKAFGVVRQLAYILPGLGIAGIFSLLFEGLQQAITAFTGLETATKQAEEANKKYEESIKNIQETERSQTNESIAHLNVLVTAARNTNLTLAERTTAVLELQKTYPAYFANLTQEEILNGRVTDSINGTVTALIKKQNLQIKEKEFAAATQRVNDLIAAGVVAQDKYNKALDVYNASITTATSNTSLGLDATATSAQTLNHAAANLLHVNEQLSKAKADQDRLADSLSNTGTGGKPGAPPGTTAALREQIAQLEAVIDLQKVGSKEQIESTQKLIALKKQLKEIEGTGPKPPTPRVSDTTNAELEAAKFNIEQKARLREADYQIDLQQQRAIFENTQESLDKRLRAYQEYSNDLKLIALKDKDAEIQAAEATLTTIESIKAKQTAGGTITPVQKKLLDQEQGYRDMLERLVKEKESALAKIEADSANAIQGIVESDIQNRIRKLDEFKGVAAQFAAEENEKNRAAYQAGLITYQQFKDQEKIVAAEAHAYELSLIRRRLEEEIAAYKGPEEGLQKLKDQLTKVNAEISLANDDLLNTTQKQTVDLKKFYKELENTALDAARTIADGFIQEEDRKIDKATQSQEKALDVEKQKRLDQATTAEEKAAIEKEFAKRQEDLERKAFEEHKRLAEKQLAIDFVIAAGKAAASVTATGPGYIYALLAAEAAVALQFAAQLAILEKQEFAKSGLVMPAPLGSGRINTRSNIPTQHNGDNVLATVRTGEVILNEYHQRLAGGPAFFRALGVPGFADGGYFGSQVQPPVFSSQIMRPTASAPDYSEKFERLEGMIGNLYSAIAAESSKPVVLNPNAVTKSQDRNSKAVNVGVL